MVLGASISGYVGSQHYCVHIRQHNIQSVGQMAFRSITTASFLDIGRYAIFSSSAMHGSLPWLVDRASAEPSVYGLGVGTPADNSHMCSRCDSNSLSRVSSDFDAGWTRAISLLTLFRMGLPSTRWLFRSDHGHFALLRFRGLFRRGMVGT